MKATWWGGVLVVAIGCSDEDWLYRARDAGAMSDVRAVIDVGMIDVGMIDVRMIDAVTPTEDVAVTDWAEVGGDGATNPTDVVTPTGLALRSSGVATGSGGGATVGTLRLTETGFEMGERACVGALCLVGGMVP